MNFEFYRLLSFYFSRQASFIFYIFFTYFFVEFRCKVTRIVTFEKKVKQTNHTITRRTIDITIDQTIDLQQFKVIRRVSDLQQTIYETSNSIVVFVEQLSLSKYFINWQSPRIIEFKLRFLQYNVVTSIKSSRFEQMKLNIIYFRN